jgi:hypothetical protein
MWPLLLAEIGVLFTPMLTDFLNQKYLAGRASGIMSWLLVVFVLIVVITFLTNIMRAWSGCVYDQNESKQGIVKGAHKGYGMLNGLWKGIICGTMALLCLGAISFTPLRILMANSSLAQGGGLSLGYLIGYFAIAYPVWGDC